MKSFLSRFGSLVLFVLSGFDRLRWCGESRLLNHSLGLQSYLWQQHILFKDFPAHAETLTRALRQQTEALAKEHGVPLLHLNSPKIDKEATALQRAAAASATPQGRIAVLTCVESCSTYRLRKKTKTATHRYQLSAAGKRITAALETAKRADITRLAEAG